MKKTCLSVNIDNIATLRQSRGTNYPEPVHAASTAEMAGADGIVVHLREDRRHIQDRDVYLLNHTIQTRLNLKMALSEEMIKFAIELSPTMVTLVPETADELTTMGGLDVAANQQRIGEAVAQLQESGIKVSLFIDSVIEQVEAANATEAYGIEINAGHYSEALDDEELNEEIAEIKAAAELADSQGMYVCVGSGLHYHNAASLAAIDAIDELSVGHAIVARAVFDGLSKAIGDMKNIIDKV